MKLVCSALYTAARQEVKVEGETEFELEDGNVVTTSIKKVIVYTATDSVR